MFIQTWLLPFLLLLTATVIAFPLGRYLAWIMDGKYRPLPVFRWFEKRLDSGPQDWKQYAGVPAGLQYRAVRVRLCGAGAPDVDAPESRRQGDALPQHHLSRRDLVHDEHGPPALGRRRAPVELQPDLLRHLHLFISAAVGFCALVAIIRALRGDSKRRQLFPRHVAGAGLHVRARSPLSSALIFLVQGSPMTFKSSYQVSTLEPAAMGTTDKGEAKQQTIVVGPVAAFESIKMLGTNGGGFFGMNSAHPFENPTGLTNFLQLPRHDDLPLRPCADVRPHARPHAPRPASSFRSCCC